MTLFRFPLLILGLVVVGAAIAFTILSVFMPTDDILEYDEFIIQAKTHRLTAEQGDQNADIETRKSIGNVGDLLGGNGTSANTTDKPLIETDLASFHQTSLAPTAEPNFGNVRPSMDSTGANEISTRAVVLEESTEPITQTHQNTSEAEQSDDVNTPLDSQLLTISGRVIDNTGKLVPAIKIRLRPSAGDGFSSSPQQSISGTDGKYSFENLLDGIYLLRTEATDIYPATGMTVRAGLNSADLLLTATNEVVVSGLISDTHGGIVDKVRVRVDGFQHQTSVDEFGRYVTIFKARPQHTYRIRFSAPGYIEQVVKLERTKLEKQKKIIQDIKLVPAGQFTEFAVSVRDEENSPVVGETVHITSNNQRSTHVGQTDRDGNVLFSQVIAGSDYRLTISPKGPYKQFIVNRLAIETGAAPFEVVLGRTAAASISGSFVDLDLNPLPEFSLSVYSNQAPRKQVRIVSDEDGRFDSVAVTTGNLTFNSLSQPQFVVSGLTLTEGQELEVQIVVDWGPWQLAGYVIDSDGSAVSGSRITLTWLHSVAGLTSRSARATVSSDDGFFRFTQLGRGIHTLAVTETDFERYTAKIEVSETVDNFQVILKSD